MKISKNQTAITLLTATAVAVTTLVACGQITKKSVSQSSAGSSSDPSQTTSFQSPGTLTIGSSTVDVPIGALPEGTLLKASNADDLAEYGLFDEVGGSKASSALSVSATATDGSATSETASALTVALFIPQDAELTALASRIQRVQDNLCALQKGKDGVLRLWRRSAMTVDAKLGGRFNFKSKWLGVFQFFYCGAMPIAGTVEVSNDGKTVTPSVAGRPIASCRYTESSGYTQCQSFVGLAFGDNQLLNGYRGKCAEASGTFGIGGCSDTGAMGTCVSGTATAKELAVIYSAPATVTDSIALAAAKSSYKSACLQVPGNTWKEVGEYSATSFANQTAAAN